MMLEETIVDMARSGDGMKMRRWGQGTVYIGLKQMVPTLFCKR
jgi:hypothetical protein